MRGMNASSAPLPSFSPACGVRPHSHAHLDICWAARYSLRALSHLQRRVRIGDRRIKNTTQVHGSSAGAEPFRSALSDSL